MDRFYCPNSDFVANMLVQAQTIPQNAQCALFIRSKVAFTQGISILKRAKVFEMHFCCKDFKQTQKYKILNDLMYTLHCLGPLTTNQIKKYNFYYAYFENCTFLRIKKNPKRSQKQNSCKKRKKKNPSYYPIFIHISS